MDHQLLGVGYNLPSGASAWGIPVPGVVAELQADVIRFSDADMGFDVICTKNAAASVREEDEVGGAEV